MENIYLIQFIDWWQNYWLWVLVIALIAFFVVFTIVILRFMGDSMRSTDAYQKGVAAALRSKDVIRLIGKPMRPASYFVGSINIVNSIGIADITISIKGPKGTGKIHVKGEKYFDVWTYSTIIFSLDNNKTSRVQSINLNETVREN